MESCSGVDAEQLLAVALMPSRDVLYVGRSFDQIKDSRLAYQ